MKTIEKGNTYTITTCTKTMESVIKDCKEWVQEIREIYNPDLIVFVAKSGFLFAKPMAEYFNCEMVDILVCRPASHFKDKLKKLIELIPDKIILAILKNPFMYIFNDRKQERDVKLSDKYEREKQKKHKNILIVDDSVDTGWTLQRVYAIVQESFPDAVIKTAAYAVIDYSSKRVNVDFFRYRNTIVLTATSRKSKQYDLFMQQYESWTTKQR